MRWTAIGWLVVLGCGSLDGDGDGLDRATEQTLGTDPTHPDTDGDGLLDGDEVLVHGTDPTLEDTDGDGLGDREEIEELGTDPLDADSDGDGLDDGAEVLEHGTDPLDDDTDGDGLTDLEEIEEHGTDPLERDSDDDGVDDDEELEDGFDPNDDDDVPGYIGGWPLQRADVKDDYEATHDEGTSPAPGQRAPRLMLRDQHGEVVDLYDFSGHDKPVILDLSADWCVPCEAISLWLGGASDPRYDGYNAVRDAVDAGEVIWITIMSDDPAPSPDVAVEWHGTFGHPRVPVLLDADQEAFDFFFPAGSWVFPSMVLLGEDMVVDAGSDTNTVLDAALAGL